MFIDTQPLIEVSSDPKVLYKINKYRELVDALPAGVITMGSFYNPHLCGKPKLPFILPVREVLKSKFTTVTYNNKLLLERAYSILFHHKDIVKNSFSLQHSVNEIRYFHINYLFIYY